MRLLYVWDADYPWDVRTEKICQAFTDAGWRVFIAARNQQGAVFSESLPEGQVERIRFPRWVGARGRKVLSFPAFINPFWWWHLFRTVKRQAIDLVIVRDLPLALTALAAARGRPVMLDMAENYPAMMEDIWLDGAVKPLDIIVRNPRLVRAVERSVITKVDHIVTVVEESSDRLRALGVGSERLTVVSNTPPLARLRTGPPRSYLPPLRVIYLGLMERHRGVSDLLDAAKILRDESIEIQFEFVGDGRDLESFRTQASAAGLGPPVVTFHGRLLHADAIALLARSHVGVIPHHPRESWHTTIPNKLFDYMAAGLAVVTSNAAPAERVVLATETGLVYKGGDAMALASCLKRLTDRATLDRYRSAGPEAVRTYYNWDFDSATLVERATKVATGSQHGHHRSE